MLDLKVPFDLDAAIARIDGAKSQGKAIVECAAETARAEIATAHELAKTMPAGMRELATAADVAIVHDLVGDERERELMRVDLHLGSGWSAPFPIDVRKRLEPGRRYRVLVFVLPLEEKRPPLVEHRDPKGNVVGYTRQ
jgi:hypothetical protein